uniref:(northern house mosquito) hypothetical protein n=1 Tax=Culex pipiens TaxID=7175 RepID=A0A8D8FKA5_CULPI
MAARAIRFMMKDTRTEIFPPIPLSLSNVESCSYYILFLFHFFFLLIAAGSVHIPMHLSTCQHHQATNSTFVPQKLASRNESSPAREEKRQSSTTATKNDHHQPRHANTSKGISKVQQLPL